MGAGKTTFGVELAHRLGREFVDLDRELESTLHETIPEIFARRGELEFRVLEQETAGLRGAGEALRVLQIDGDLAWQCYAAALLADDLSGDEPESGSGT